MNRSIQHELQEFKQYHKNRYNIYFHILCGFICMATFCLLFKQYSNLVLIIYGLLLLFTIDNIILTGGIIILLMAIITIGSSYNLSLLQLGILFLVFYFLPDLSHYLTNEPTVLTIYTITPFTLFTNIFYLLPFSILSLFNAK
jgi:uncharacterized membrane protein YGL010W